jgi:NAD(P)-dependent dehydrogenase (short-subunit alcohol dehydrogenase family)
MKEQGGGRIVNIASISGKGMRGASNISYAASKGAAIAVTRVAATELAPFDITVNSVCPGVTRTALVDRMIEQNPAIIDEIVSRSVLRRFMEPSDIADAVLFLASPLSRHITGQSINVDGGTIWD